MLLFSACWQAIPVKCELTQCVQKKALPEARAADQKEIDKAVLEAVKSVPHLAQYLAASFSLSKGDRPHLMKW